ncbi:hypothetical protein FOL46_002340, partial [Perkinsus olseni]
ELLAELDPRSRSTRLTLLPRDAKPIPQLECHSRDDSLLSSFIDPAFTDADSSGDEDDPRRVRDRSILSEVESWIEEESNFLEQSGLLEGSASSDSELESDLEEEAAMGSRNTCRSIPNLDASRSDDATGSDDASRSEEYEEYEGESEGSDDASESDGASESDDEDPRRVREASWIEEAEAQGIEDAIRDASVNLTSDQDGDDSIIAPSTLSPLVNSPAERSPVGERPVGDVTRDVSSNALLYQR